MPSSDIEPHPWMKEAVTVEFSSNQYMVPKLALLDVLYGQVAVRDTDFPTQSELPPVLLLHGLCSESLSNWFLVYSLLAQTRRVVAVDIPGHGATRLHGKFSVRSAASMTAQVLDELRLPPVVAVGYSLGGPVAQQLAATVDVAGLVSVATAARTAPSVSSRAFLTYASALYGVTSESVRTVSRLLRFNHGPPIVKGSDVTLQHHARWMFSNLNKRAVAEAGGELGRWDSRSWVSQLNVPAVSVVTSTDRAVPPLAQVELASLLSAHTIEVPSGHVFCLDKTFASTIASAVTKVDSLLLSGEEPRKTKPT